LALRRVLEEEDTGVLELPSVIRDKKGGNGRMAGNISVIGWLHRFSRSKYRMSKVSRSIELELHTNQ
jgi:hypothetical protein